MLLFTIFNPDHIRHGLYRLTSGLALCALGILSVLPSSHAQGMPSREQSVVLMQVITTRGETCGLLSRWQVASIRAMMEQEMQSWPRERRENIADAADKRLAETSCEAPVVTTWIEAAEPNMDGEMLPGYLLAYRYLAEMDAPPEVFRATALRLDNRPVIAAINAKLADMQAADLRPEGGGPWPEYIDRTTLRIKKALEGYMSGDAEASTSTDQMAALITQSVVITRLWYEEYRTQEPEN